MFARYFLELPFPIDRVESEVLGAPRAWLDAVATEASDRGDQVLIAVGLGDRLHLERSLAIDVGTPIHATSKTVLPLSCRATGTTRGLFPVVAADLELASLGPSTTQLAISATYNPPLGALGRMLDRAVLHRVAEAALKHFLDRVGETIGAYASATADGPRSQPG